MSGFKLDDYVDVAERIRVFSDRYPDGSLQSEVFYQEQPPGWFAVAKAYREQNDARPGVGHAFEPVPGKTPYTKDSECMNAETAAWGRAIIALGFPSKKIASAQEVRARQGAGQTPPAKAAAAPKREPQPAAAAALPTPDDLNALYELVKAKGGDVKKTMTSAETATEAGKLETWFDGAMLYWQKQPDSFANKIPDAAKAAA